MSTWIQLLSLIWNEGRPPCWEASEPPQVLKQTLVLNTDLSKISKCECLFTEASSKEKNGSLFNVLLGKILMSSWSRDNLKPHKHTLFFLPPSFLHKFVFYILIRKQQETWKYSVPGMNLCILCERFFAFSMFNTPPPHIHTHTLTQ